MCLRLESGLKYGRFFWYFFSGYELYYLGLVVEIFLDFDDI